MVGNKKNVPYKNNKFANKCKVFSENIEEKILKSFEAKVLSIGWGIWKRMPNLHVGILKCMKERLKHLANQLSIKCSLGKCSAGCDLWPFASRLDLFKLRNELSLSTNIEIVFLISMTSWPHFLIFELWIFKYNAGPVLYPRISIISNINSWLMDKTEDPSG